jgi:hypothetical protein
MGLLERHGGEARVMVPSDRKRAAIQAEGRKHVEAGAELLTDELASYVGLSREYIHNVINHAETYVEGHIHTNGMENFWSLLKRAIKGTYVSVEPFHLFRYLDERSFRYNARRTNDRTRFLDVVRTIAGRRLTYKSLIGEPALATTPA